MAGATIHHPDLPTSCNLDTQSAGSKTSMPTPYFGALSLITMMMGAAMTSHNQYVARFILDAIMPYHPISFVCVLLTVAVAAKRSAYRASHGIAQALGDELPLGVVISPGLIARNLPYASHEAAVPQAAVPNGRDESKPAGRTPDLPILGLPRRHIAHHRRSRLAYAAAVSLTIARATASATLMPSTAAERMPPA